MDEKAKEPNKFLLLQTLVIMEMPQQALSPATEIKIMSHKLELHAVCVKRNPTVIVLFGFPQECNMLEFFPLVRSFPVIYSRAFRNPFRRADWKLRLVDQNGSCFVLPE